MPYASMGYIGSVKLWQGVSSGTNFSAAWPSGEAGVDGANSFVRANSIGLQAKQSIEKPPLIDSRFDYTTYKLGPKEVEGEISFPAIHDTGAGMQKALWNATMKRDTTNGRLIYSTDATVKYAGNIGNQYGAGGVIFAYTGCQINTLALSVAQSAGLDITANFIGIDKVVGQDFDPTYIARNARQVTWNDVVVGFKMVDSIVGGNTVVKGDVIRSFSLNVSNNIQRFYSLNQKLAPVDIAATKRDISGSIETLGRLANLGTMATTNQDRCAEYSSVFFGFNSCTDSSWYVYFPGTVFEIEQMSLSTELYVTTINFHVLPGAYQASFANGPALAAGTDSSTFEYTGTVPSEFIVS